MKYRLTDETILWKGHLLHRIQATKDFGIIREGDLGGFIENEKNLSHEGVAWVWGDAQVYGKAEVYEDAWVYDKAEVYDNAKVHGKARVHGEAKVYGVAEVCGNWELL